MKRSPRFVSVLVLTLLALIGPIVPTSAQAPPFQFVCTADPGPQDIFDPGEIRCGLFDPNGGPIAGVDIDGELLAGSVTDTDGTTEPPDLSEPTDAAGIATFSYPGVAGGTDNVCLWVDLGEEDDIDDGGQCTNDFDTDVVTWVWAEPETAPVLRVTGGLSENKARALAKKLGVPEKKLDKQDVLEKDGTILYLDEKLFQRIPTKPYDGAVADDEDDRKVTPEGILIGMLEKLDPISDKTARTRVTKALNDAGLALDDIMKGSQSVPVVGNGEFEILPVEDGPVGAPAAKGRAPADKAGIYEIDTTVSFTTEIGGIPLEGPGSNLRVSFDPSGKVSLIRMAARRMTPGQEIPIISKADAADLCAETYEGPGQAADLDTRLIYYAPDPSFKKIQKVYPHYECSGVIQEGTESFEVRPFALPAIQLTQMPDVEIETSNEGPVVNATSTVTGGTPPYRYQWTSVLEDIPEGVPTTDPNVSFEVQVREEAFSSFAIVKLVVTDADGLSRTKYGVTPVSAIVGGVPIETRRTAFGASWVGEAYSELSRLRWPATNSRGFMETMEAAGIRRSYAFGERMAYETDWVDPDLRPSGKDDLRADNVDIFWFTGHANGDGYLLAEGADRDDAFVRFNEVQWGDRDLEWASIAACGPLQEVGSGVLRDRWGPVFQGLHILNGYATVSWDGDREGRTYAGHLVGAGGSEPKTVRRAWSLMAIDAQSPDVVHGSMGPIGIDWLTTIDDHFWGRGTVGPDIPNADIAAFWVLRYPS